MSVVDFNAVANAVAARFAAAAITAPSGETTIRVSTAALPDAITQEPTVLVLPPDVDLSYGPSVRKGTLVFPVRFYIYKVRDNKRNAVLILKWLTALYAQLPETLAHLGLSSYVNSAAIGSLAPRELTYADVKFHGIELTVEVNVSEGFTATA